MFIFALIISLSRLPSVGQADTFTLANNLYNEGKYEYALEKYEYIVSTGVKNYALYYNLGNCYFKLGKIGSAILFYKRAQKLKPADTDIDFNLNFARARRVDEFKISEPPKIIKTLLDLLKSLSVNTLLVVSSILYFGLVAIIIVGAYSIRPKVKFIKTLRLGLSIVLVMVLAIFFSNLGQLNRKEGVLLEQSAELRSGPSEENTLICTIHEGMEMRILEEGGSTSGKNDWLKVILPNDVLGWVQANRVGKI